MKLQDDIINISGSQKIQTRTLLTISSSFTSNFLLLRGERVELVARLVLRVPDEVVAGLGDLYLLRRLDGSNKISTYGTRREEGIHKHLGATEHRERDIEIISVSETESNLNNQGAFDFKHRHTNLVLIPTCPCPLWTSTLNTTMKKVTIPLHYLTCQVSSEIQRKSVTFCQNLKAVKTNLHGVSQTLALTIQMMPHTAKLYPSSICINLYALFSHSTRERRV